jgi:glycosyltransferase involved in cell wall biosynthesis
MGKRMRIGIIYSYNEHWIGGSYYVENLIHALATLPEENQPAILLLTDDEASFRRVKSLTSYPHLTWHPLFPVYNLAERAVNKLWRKVFGGNLVEKRVTASMADRIFPCMSVDQEALAVFPLEKKIFWIPDFQEDHLPDFFSQQDISRRKAVQLAIARHASAIVLSSRDSQKDFIRLYPDASPRQFVIPFAVTHPPFRHISMEVLKERYKLPQSYLFCPNQFWKHKNQQLVLEAIAKLKGQGHEIHVAFSGKTSDYRNPDYFSGLQSFINDHGIGGDVSFLGFLPRDEQLQLMAHAHAIIQPSLFEGWSTVVEDAKAMNQQIIVSDLGVHREQLAGYPNASFFDPKNVDSLVESIVENHSDFNSGIDYVQNVRTFGKVFEHSFRTI